MVQCRLPLLPTCRSEERVHASLRAINFVPPGAGDRDATFFTTLPVPFGAYSRDLDAAIATGICEPDAATKKRRSQLAAAGQVMGQSKLSFGNFGLA